MPKRANFFARLLSSRSPPPSCFFFPRSVCLVRRGTGMSLREFRAFSSMAADVCPRAQTLSSLVRREVLGQQLW
jgi:hypothetical protein